MLTAVILAFLFTLVVGAPMVIFASLNSELPRRGLTGGIVTMIGLFVANIILFYVAMPVIGFNMDTFWKSFFLWFIEALIVLVVSCFAADDTDNGFDFNGWSGIAIGILVISLIAYIFAGIWGTDRAHRMAAELQVTAADQKVAGQELKDFTESDPDHIPLMTSDMALNKASQSMNSITQLDVGGFKGNASSVYELTTPVFQSVKGHAVYIIAPRPSSWRNSNKVDGIVPFYMQVDAENPDAPAVPIYKDDAGNPINIRYSPGGYFSHDLFRHAWLLEHDKVLSDPTLEVDDAGRPFFTLTKDRLTLNRQATVPAKLLLIDAQTGAITSHELNDVPSWVDRVYSANTVQHMLKWWGEWNAATWQVFETTANRYKPAEDPVVVYTKGGTPSFQSIMTSQNNDTAASYLMMTDARSGHATSYQVNGLTLESVAANAITKSGAQPPRKLIPVHLVLYKIYGQLTWVSPLEGEEDEHHIYQGVAMISATDPNGSSVVIGRTKEAALEAYRLKVAQGNGNNKGPESGGNHKVVEGTVQYVNPIVEGGNTVFYFGLKEYPRYQFKAQPTDQMPELRSIHIGAHVKVGFLDVGAPMVEVGSYDDVGVPNPI